MKVVPTLFGAAYVVLMLYHVALAGKLLVNFDRNILQLMRESRHLARMKVHHRVRFEIRSGLGLG